MKLLIRCRQFACPRMCVNIPTYACVFEAWVRDEPLHRTADGLLEDEDQHCRQREGQDDRRVIRDSQLRHARRLARGHPRSSRPNIPGFNTAANRAAGGSRDGLRTYSGGRDVLVMFLRVDDLE